MDAKGKTTYYEYDEFQRLSDIKDQDKKIISIWIIITHNKRIKLPYHMTTKTIKRLPGKRLLIVFSFLFTFFGLQAQTQVTAPLIGVQPAGEYYSYSSITLSPGFSFTAAAGKSLHLYILDPGCQPLLTVPSANQNYIITSVPREKFTALSGSFTTCDLMQTVEYFDGLGRPLQTVQVKGSPSGKDIVQPVVYDEFGREAVKYLPYALQSGASDGSFKTDALSRQDAFYTAPPAGVRGNLYPWSVNLFEPSPLNRVLEQGAPGAAWQPFDKLIDGSGHTAKVEYTTNNVTDLGTTATTRLAGLYTISAISATDQSRTLARGSAAAANYGEGQLYVTVTKDENWTSGRGNTTEEYKDKEGHIVLKRTFNTEAGTLQLLSTYYVYDDLGNLAYVLPPNSGADGAKPDATELNELCYQYRYDERNRLTQKKVPGKGWEYMVYNKLDQPVLSQDANQRSANQWTVRKYDALGRVIMTGLWNATSAIALSDLQASIYTGAQWDIRDPSNATTGYNVTSYPAMSKILTINYYDTYTGIPLLPSRYAAPDGVGPSAQGLLTATKTVVLNTLTATPPATPHMLWAVNYYDDEGHSIKAYKQHYLGAVVNDGNYDAISTTYNFTDQPTESIREHFTSANAVTASVTITNSWAYDHMGRKTTSSQQLKNGSGAADDKVLLAESGYNEIGQLSSKDLHKVGTAAFKQGIDYSYNERGWLQMGSSALFQEQLWYDKVVAVNGATPLAQFNGNIAIQSWGTGAALNTKSEAYTYDQLNRLMESNSATGNEENGITYDLVGNIKTLKRYKATTLIDKPEL
jgi:hypothetical protein